MAKALGGSNSEAMYAIQITSDGGYVVAGYSVSNDGDVIGNDGLWDYWIVKLDAAGTLQWQKTIGGAGYDCANSVQTTADGGYIIAGNSFSNNGDTTGNHGDSDFWVVKLAPDTLANPVFEKQDIVIYPNPVCNVLQIQMPTNSTITAIKIIDINGKVIDGQTQNSNTINVENLSKGIYILEAYSDDYKYTGKFAKE